MPRSSFFSSSVRGSFFGAFTISALTFFGSISVYIVNNYPDNYINQIVMTYTHLIGLSLGFFAPLLIGFTTALFVKFCNLISNMLNQYNFLNFAALFGLFLIYSVITLLGVTGILYVF